MSYSDKELADALGKYRDRHLAEFFVLVFGLAAHNYPEEIKKAIGQVFDLSAVRLSIDVIMAGLTACQDRAREVLDEVNAISDRIKKVEKEMARAEEKLQVNLKFFR